WHKPSNQSILSKEKKYVYLKYIEIQGFKSFPDKTRLSFDRVLTGIVGPNGSGKSNLSDAVRWVLGEQSSKSLRGGKMEDVIFGGTKLRKPMGFAQVSLCLDNSDGKIADVGKEIVVTRRYYRSGDSEYAVNGAAVRLRDLREMFLDTGLGRDGYSIIGQGRISEVVECKPADRREVFEEASGIAKYRFRKNEAERKLNAAEDNLSRLRDIAGELESRLGPLAEQSRKAKLFLTLSEERKKLEISLYCDTVRRSQENLRAQDEKIEIARLDYAGIEQKLAGQNEEIEALYERNRLSNAEADAISNTITEKTDAISALESKIAVVKNDIMHAERELRALQDDKGALDEDGSAVMNEINARRLEAEQKNAEAEELSAVIEGLQKELEDLIENSEATDLRRAETAKKLTAVQNEIAELRVLAAGAQSVLQTLAEREQTIHDALPAEQKRHDECAAEHKQAKAYAEQLSKESAAKENEANGYAMKLRSRTEKREAIAARLAAADAEAERIRSRISALGEIERNMEGFMPPVRRVMQAKQSRELGGIIGTVGSLLEVKSGLEIAIETALGAAMQNIVVENERAAKQGIAYLKETKAGRATFLPLDSIKPSRFDFADRLNDDGVIGLASDLVSCDAAYKKVADYLLGRIIVMEDLDYASALARRIGYRCRIVTRDGQQINAGGSYTGGFSSRQGGTFSRRSEIEALQQKLQQMQKDTEADREAEAALASEITLLTAQHTAVLSELTAAREDGIRAEAQLERYAREMEALERNRDVAEQELARIADTRTEKQTEIARGEGRVKVLAEDAARLERALAAEDSADGFMQRRAGLMEDIGARRIARAELIKDAERLAEAAEELQRRSADALDRTANLDAAM
ncbi:MAG: chromosome segregation protein SMC, partial [Oscillospiraceae bacterium]|nr:chromosome segregation protein SMC [Oscillospiraceae bacterium]